MCEIGSWADWHVDDVQQQASVQDHCYFLLGMGVEDLVP